METNGKEFWFVDEVIIPNELGVESSEPDSQQNHEMSHVYMLQDTFVKMIENDEFIEHAEVHSGKRYGNFSHYPSHSALDLNQYYSRAYCLAGSSIAAVNAVTDQGKMCILDIDVQGADSVKLKAGVDMPKTKCNRPLSQYQPDQMHAQHQSHSAISLSGSSSLNLHPLKSLKRGSLGVARRHQNKSKPASKMPSMKLNRRTNLLCGIE